MNPNDLTEAALWNFINAAGWWWWGSIASLAAVLLWSTFRLPSPGTRFGRVLRIMCLIGAFLITFSPMNTAFGPIGEPILIVTLIGINLQLYNACLKAGRMKSPPEGASIFIRLMSIVVDRKAPNGNP